MKRLETHNACAIVVALTAACLIRQAGPALAQGAASTAPATLPPVIVRGIVPAEGALPDVQDTRIYQGKKTSVADLEALPPVVNNNYREAFSLLPGLLISEMPTPGHANLTYRGIGDPHESEYVLILQDGVPLVSDWVGYSTAYYTPPLESVQRVEMIRGGSALLYGPQPGPVINYVTYNPAPQTAWEFDTRHLAGSWGFYSTYTRLAGTLGNVGYLAGFHHRQGDGFRDANADFSVFQGQAKITFPIAAQWRVTLDFYGYSSEAGEPGRLTLAQYQANREQTLRPMDRLFMERYVPTVTLEGTPTHQTHLTLKTWTGHQDRLSRRQNAAGTFMNLDQQIFDFVGLDTRLRHDWIAGRGEHHFTGGFVLYAANSPRSRERAPGLGTSLHGEPRFDLDRHSLYGAVFAENRFAWGRWGIIPAFRLELMETSVKENFNREVTRPLLDETFSRAVPLLGLGLTFDWHESHRWYANISQGYRPPRYDDLVNPTSNTQLPPSDLQEGRTLTFETGFRGNLTPWLAYDTSVFGTDYDNVIENRDLGAGNFERSNSGRARYYGWETSLEFQLIPCIESWTRHPLHPAWGRWTWFGSAALLHAEFIAGRNDGRTPAYAPDMLLKTGLVGEWNQRFKIALTGSYVDAMYWQDSNQPGSVGLSRIPDFTVWDLSAEAALYRDNVRLLAGIQNLFDRDYFSRVRSDGIEPMPGRNFYLGLRIRWF
ncbi:TonB-dependent receptor [Limisphaera ngatamarikiensis]|uniref:TonB-dependent receptor n=1 Tax=Limisphaera ngatamarikiensis TaxID=1324935 RepID=A0A6M1RQB4_9BACT|nr:TonB-dependent receptor [Limisphaera ngatamarikiensis]NGO38865.1 TonB-dependent receptor [Limisphaera ngatamarikiensis]